MPGRQPDKNSQQTLQVYDRFELPSATIASRQVPKLDALNLFESIQIRFSQRQTCGP